MYICLYVYVCKCVWAQVAMEARSISFLEVRVSGDSKPPDVSSWQYALSISSPLLVYKRVPQ